MVLDSTSTLGNPVIASMRLTSTNIHVFNHIHPSWKQTNNCFIHVSTSVYRPNWGMYNSGTIPNSSKPWGQYIGTNWIGPHSTNCIDFIYFKMWISWNFLMIKKGQFLQVIHNVHRHELPIEWMDLPVDIWNYFEWLRHHIFEVEYIRTIWSLNQTWKP